MVKGYLIIAMRLMPFAKLLIRHGVSLRFRYLACLAFLLQSSFWSSFLSWREQRLHGRRLKHAPVPPDPVFIVGHWRSGSTFLHQLLRGDPRFTVPDQVQCTYPESFISGRKFIAPVMAFMLPATRPMDNVKSGLDEPQEDEYALFRMCGGLSPLETLLFPHTGDYFLSDYDLFLPPASEIGRWENAVTQLAAKLQYVSGKRIVFKNPFHSLRIPILKKLFPGAQFIHIFRNPFTVVPSTRHLWTVVGRENALRKEWRPPSLESVLEVYATVLTRTREALAALPPACHTEVRFENLEQDTVGELKKVYAHLSLDFSDEFAANLNGFLKSVAQYKKNRYELREEDKNLIYSRMKGVMEEYGYE